MSLKEKKGFKRGDLSDAVFKILKEQHKKDPEAYILQSAVSTELRKKVGFKNVTNQSVHSVMHRWYSDGHLITDPTGKCKGLKLKDPERTVRPITTHWPKNPPVVKNRMRNYLLADELFHLLKQLSATEYITTGDAVAKIGEKLGVKVGVSAIKGCITLWLNDGHLVLNPKGRGYRLKNPDMVERPTTGKGTKGSKKKKVKVERYIKKNIVFTYLKKLCKQFSDRYFTERTLAEEINKDVVVLRQTVKSYCTIWFAAGYLKKNPDGGHGYRLTDAAAKKKKPPVIKVVKKQKDQSSTIDTVVEDIKKDETKSNGTLEECFAKLQHLCKVLRVNVKFFSEKSKYDIQTAAFILQITDPEYHKFEEKDIMRELKRDSKTPYLFSKYVFIAYPDHWGKGNSIRQQEAIADLLVMYGDLSTHVCETPPLQGTVFEIEHKKDIEPDTQEQKLSIREKLESIYSTVCIHFVHKMDAHKFIYQVESKKLEPNWKREDFPMMENLKW